MIFLSPSRETDNPEREAQVLEFYNHNYDNESLVVNAKLVLSERLF